MEEFPLLFVRFPFIMKLICYKGELWLGELIAFVSGKGGTGKTTVSAGVASALAQSGSSVLCIDCDVGLRNMDITLAMSDCGAPSFLEVLRGEYTLSSAARNPLFPTLSFLTAPARVPADKIPLGDFGGLLEEARKLFDYVIMDAPAGIEAGFRLAAQFADRIALVTGADPASVRDATRAGQELSAMGKTNVRLIVNRVDPHMVRAMHITVDDIMDQAGLPLLGVVQEDSDVVLAAAFHEPLIHYKKKGAAAACRRIAQRIQGHRVAITL